MPTASPSPTPTDLAEALHRTRRARAAVAAQDFATFIEFAMVPEGKSTPIVLAPFQREWCRLVTEHDRVTLHAHYESGKTALLSVAWAVWCLGRNVNERVCIISNTHQMAERIIRAVAKHIEGNERVREVFPHLRPGKPWRDDMLVVDGRSPGIKDASLSCVGNINGALTGARISRLVLDDLETWTSTRTPTLRDATWSWVTSTVFSRLTADAKVTAISTPWHPDDVSFRLARLPGWNYRRFPVVTPEGMPHWPEVWPYARIEKARDELGPYDYSRMLLCLPTDDESAVFKREWLLQAIAAGEGLACGDYVTRLPEGAYCTIGVDIALGLTGKHDLSAIVGLMVHPDGRRQVMFCDSGRWTAVELMQRIAAAHQRFGRARVTIETVAAQKLLHDLLRDTAQIPVDSFTTGGGTRSLLYQAEGCGSELAKGRWAIPSRGGRPATPGLAALVDDLAGFTPSAHVPDRVAGMLLARVGAVKGEQKVQWFDPGRLGLSLSR